MITRCFTNQTAASTPPSGPTAASISTSSSGKYLKLWQGPQHPGITGNMSVELTVCGDEVVEGKTHVGYLHRGFEKLMERRTFIQCFPIVCRICVPEPDFNEYCYAAAVEELAGIEIPEQARWIRTLILEMGRINSYLMYLGGQAGALGQGAQSSTRHVIPGLIRNPNAASGTPSVHRVIPGLTRNPNTALSTIEPATVQSPHIQQKNAAPGHVSAQRLAFHNQPGPPTGATTSPCGCEYRPYTPPRTKKRPPRPRRHPVRSGGQAPRRARRSSAGLRSARS